MYKKSSINNNNNNIFSIISQNWGPVSVEYMQFTSSSKVEMLFSIDVSRPKKEGCIILNKLGAMPEEFCWCNILQIAIIVTIEIKGTKKN